MVRCSTFIKIKYGHLTMARRAGIYARISPTPAEGAGWQRQLADCRELIKARGWEVGGEYVDRDLSAYRAKRRPEWERLLVDLDAGVVDALVVYHPDRAYRRGDALEALIDIVERRGVEVATVKAGDLDLATATGRMGARIVAAVSRHESERMSERVSRAKRERAALGRPAGGGLRPFGYKADKVTIEPAEADLIRYAAERIAAGGSMYAELEAWNDQGWLTTAGKPWSISSLRRVLTSPRVAGLRAYRGQVVGEAVWPAILERDLWDRLCAMTASRAAGPRPGGSWLLSGMIGCPHCGRRLYGSTDGSWRSYKCAPSGTVGVGCGRASISAPAADARVSGVMEGLLADPPGWLSKALTAPEGFGAAEATAIETQRVKLAQRWAAGLLGDDEYDAARTVLSDRMAELDVPSPVPFALAELRAGWESGSVEVKRAAITALLRLPIGLTPGRMSNPGDRLTVHPAWD